MNRIKLCSRNCEFRRYKKNHLTKLRILIYFNTHMRIRSMRMMLKRKMKGRRECRGTWRRYLCRWIMHIHQMVII